MSAPPKIRCGLPLSFVAVECARSGIASSGSAARHVIQVSKELRARLGREDPTDDTAG